MAPSPTLWRALCLSAGACAAAAVVGCTSEDDCLPLASTPRCLPSAVKAPPASPCVLDYAFNESGWCSCAAQPGGCTPLTAANATAKRQWLVVGDSISLGYINALAAAVPDFEVVHAPSFAGGSENNDNSHWVATCLLGWLGRDPARWDVVSINAGAHDYAFPDNEHLSTPHYTGFVGAALDALAAALRPGATIIWARITPVPTDPAPQCVLLPGRLEKDVVAYNAAADAVVAAKKGVKSCDLHKVITDVCGVGYAACNITQCGGPHFSAEGFALLGQKMAQCAA